MQFQIVVLFALFAAAFAAPVPEAAPAPDSSVDIAPRDAEPSGACVTNGAPNCF